MPEKVSDRRPGIRLADLDLSQPFPSAGRSGKLTMYGVPQSPHDPKDAGHPSGTRWGGLIPHGSHSLILQTSLVT